MEKKLDICFKLKQDLPTLSLLSIRCDKSAVRRIQLCEVNHRNCSIVTNLDKKKIVHKFVKEAFTLESFKFKQESVKIFQTDLNIERNDFIKSFKLSQSMKQYSNLINCVGVYKALGSHHKSFHKKPKNSKIEHSCRRSNLKMVEFFVHGED